MSVWVWVLVAAGAWLAVSLLVSAALGAVLSRIGSEFSGRLEREAWATARLTREGDAEEVSTAEQPISAGEVPAKRARGATG
jgi:hypothetical protein